MYQFLCLLGPAVITWLLRKKYSKQKQEGREALLTAVAEIISYAFIQMAVILLVCKPLGRVQLVILSDGSLDIQYGSTAVFMSVCLSAVLGFTAVKDIQKADSRLDQETKMRQGGMEEEDDRSR